jgi:hypothetical protein
MRSVARRIVDGAMLHLIKMWLEAPVEETDERGNTHRSTRNRDEGRGTPQGSLRLFSTLLASLTMSVVSSRFRAQSKALAFLHSQTPCSGAKNEIIACEQ